MTSRSERVDVEIVVPVHDEQRVLQESVWRLHRSSGGTSSDSSSD